ncbi:geminin-like [Anopheles nili]|uniref:geminin-like n=1 Tax=Anopheles nili TaxID=185578 RepID=UPI00237BDE98|nr:geminin-like [Anopheles nili]
MNASSLINIKISEDTVSEQEKTMKTSRMTLKDVQNVVSILKENVCPGKQLAHVAAKDLPMTSIKSALKGAEPTESKRCKMLEQHSKATQTTFEQEHNLTAKKPTEGYWEKVAEKRRVALAESLDENAKLHMEIETLKETLSTSETLTSYLQGLVETMTEMLNENDAKTSNPNPENDSGIAHSLLADGNDD